MMKGSRDSYDSENNNDSSSKRCRKRRRSRSRSLSRTRSKDRSYKSHRNNYDYHHSPHCKSYRTHRYYRGSSGTRTHKRSRDREIRLQQYYKFTRSSKKKWAPLINNDDNGGRRSAEGSSRYHYSRRSSPKRDSRRKSSSAQASSSSSHVRDDEDGHLIYRAGDWLQNRYEIQSLLGEGTFGKCLACYDRKRDRVIALKIIKNIEKYREAAKLEVKVLMKIARKDPEQKKLCIELLSTFNHHGHICLAFPKLGKSVFDFMKENLYQPYPLSQVQHIAYQLLTSVEFLHSIKLTHTDLKPENMLFVDSSYNTIWSENARQEIHLLHKADVRLIDFGSATFDDEHHSTIVSTRHYRAPEVVLELGWSQPCDIWSCGCIIFELFTGNTLFQTHDNKEHLAMMNHILGPLPSTMIKATKKTKYFSNGELQWDPRSEEGKYVRDNCKTLKEYITLGGHHNTTHFYDFLKQTLAYDPKERITAVDAMKHPYFDSLSTRGQSDCSR